VQTTERRFTDLHNFYRSRRRTVDICARILFLLLRGIIFLLLMTGTWYNTDDTKLAGWIKRDMILDRVALKQGEAHCGRGLITDPIAHVVIDVDADLE